ncbi:MAG: hypothetical protein NTY23_12630 [Chloroflexi bacterium]|nr:hypothetical protein [Chloroflexota bacterium]
MTPTPSRTPSSTLVPEASVLGRVDALYDGPGIQYSYMADLRAGERLEVLGGFQECSWLKVSEASGLSRAGCATMFRSWR